MPIGGVRCAEKVASVLQAVVGDAVEVGPGVSGLRVVHEEPLGGGPLVALCAGAKALYEVGCALPVLVLACDLPLVTETVLRTIAEWPGSRSVVPIIDGHSQPLCARWSVEDLATAADLVGSGMRSMRSLLELPGVVLVEEDEWPTEMDLQAMSDVDTPADLDRIGVTLDRELPNPEGTATGS